MKYICTICGYIYDEAAGSPQSNIAAGTLWKDLPDDWVCPICGAPKSAFELKEETIESTKVNKEVTMDYENWDVLSLSALCSNLEKGCEKQCLNEEAKLFHELSVYFESKATAVAGNMAALSVLLKEDMNSLYPIANQMAIEANDCGAKRVLTWSEKVTRLQASLIERYENEKGAMLENTSVYVCEICGFIYIGDTPPDICPICKVPSFKLQKVERS